MGQFLAIGLSTKITIKKSEASTARLNSEELQEYMQRELLYTPEIYTLEENDKWYSFTLSNDILHGQLLPFLDELYPQLYSDPQCYENLLRELNRLSTSEWMDLAKTKSEEVFQFDSYGICDCLSYNYSTVHVYHECLLLSLEGKVIMETFERQFRFLKYTMMQAFQKFSLSGALRIYITG